MSSAHLVVGGVGRPGLVPVLEQAERPVLGHPPLRVAVPAVHLGGAPDHVAVGLVDTVVVGVVHGGLSVPRAVAALEQHSDRTEERCVGKECVSTCQSRWASYHIKIKT